MRGSVAFLLLLSALALPALFLVYVLVLIPFTPSTNDLRRAKSEVPAVVMSADGVVLAAVEVGALPDILAGMDDGAPLTDQDVAGQHVLSPELLDAEILGIAVAAVAAGTYALLMSHESLTLP